MEERYYVITIIGAVPAFDGATLCPTSGWERMVDATNQEHGKYNRLTFGGPVGVFTPEVLGRGRGRGSASLVRVWCNGPVLGSGDHWLTRASHIAAEGTPVSVARELPSNLSLNPADAPPKELGPTDELVVNFIGADRAATITIVVVDLSEDEYREWTRTRWLASKSSCGEPTSDEYTLTAAATIEVPTRDLTFVHLNAAINTEFVLPSPATMSMKQLLLIDNVGADTVSLRIPAGVRLNGSLGAGEWIDLSPFQGVTVRKVNATMLHGTQGEI